MIRLLRRLWHRLAYRIVVVESDMVRTEVAVPRWERLTKPGYYFEAKVRQVGWDDWRRVGLFAEEVRNSRGCLIALRINMALALDESCDASQAFYIDEPRLEAWD